MTYPLVLQDTYRQREGKKEKEIRKGTIEYVISPLETKKNGICRNNYLK